MKTIIIGAGKVGYTLAENLSQTDHDVTIIDKNPSVLSKAEENLDVLCLRGNGVSTNILMEAGIKSADLLIAVTNSDEVNMVCCLTAKKLGAKRTIARIRDLDYAHELSLLKEELDLDLIINPEKAAADEIASLLSFSSAIDVEEFAKGKVKMVEIKVTEDMGITKMKLKDICKDLTASILVGVIVRDEEVIVPNGESMIHVGDEIYLLGKEKSLYNFLKQLGKQPSKVRNVMITGGGRISIYLSRLLKSIGMKVKIIEIDRERCNELSELLPEALIIHGDGTDEELLQLENIDEMDAFIAMTGMDEENLVSAILAKQNGAKKIITKISRLNYANIVKNLGIDSVISPKIITSTQILKYVRGDSIESLYRIIGGQAEITEIIADSFSSILNVKLKDLKIDKDIIIATIVRKNEILIPHGNDLIKEGDRVILISKNKNISNLDDMIVNFTGGIRSEF
jgi:trk system potassium uptake protein TrkA